MHTKKQVKPDSPRKAVASRADKKGKLNQHYRVQTTLQRIIDSSPLMLAQRKKLEAISYSGRLGASVQMKAVGILGNLTVDDGKYANGNWGTISTHVAGEWNRSNTSTPKGGHVLNAMITKWGAVHENVTNERTAATNASGVYFTSAAPVANKISGTIFNYFLVDYSNTSKKLQSKTKNSSFWPQNWSTANLGTILADSHITNTGDTYASKAVTNHWFTWHSLGDDTAYPLARYSKMS